MFNWIKTKVSARPAAAAPPSGDPQARGRALRLEGNAWLDKGNVGAALASYEESVQQDPHSVDSRVSLGYALSELGRFEDAQRELSEAVRLDAGSFDGLYLLGTTQRALNQLEAAIAAWRSAMALRPDFEPCRRDLILGLVQTGDLAGAEEVANAGLTANPQSADMPYLLGNIQATRGEVDRSVASYRRAVEINAGHARAHQALGEALKLQGRVGDAVESHRRAVMLDPASAEARIRLASALHDDGQLVAAIAVYRQVLALDEKLAEVHVNMGYALQQTGHLADAVESYRRAIALRPELAEAHSNLGNALTELGRLDDALQAYRQALTIKPDDARTYNNMAGMMVLQGKVDEALEHFQRALVLAPDYVSAYSNMLFALNYHPDKSAEEIFLAYREFDRRFARGMRDGALAHANNRNAQRRIKVGYVSPDFRRHVAHFFLAPLFEHHDRAEVEVYAYSDVLTEDDVTATYRRSADHWVPMAGMTDKEVVERIRADGIDILVDLAGHTGKNRIGVFAHKPAPVSFSWMGFGYTTGVSAIDYFLTDAAGVPEGFDHLFAEKPWRLQTPAYAFRPNDGMGKVSPLPACALGHVTFGTLTRAIRINHRSIRVWSEILRRVEGSRLVIDSQNFSDHSVRAALLAKFAAEGIDRDRLEVGFHTPPWDLMRAMDIGLDCFPHNSGTTLFESLYMGVPFVTLAGRPSVGRLGSSILEGIGRREWIAQTEEEYIDKAVALASDLPKLAALRVGLRNEMEASPLRDEPGFVRRVECAYRETFALWAAKQ